MAPQAGDVLVLDEVQWADDPERGSAWTRLLLAGEYRDILLLGALDALPLVRNAFPDAEVKVFERKLPLEFVGERRLTQLEPGTVVVAFCRRAVLALAGEINRRRPGKVAVLYGAMPLASRRAGDRPLPRAAAPRSASPRTCSATASTCPCETLLFAETSKFDGQERRELLPWELAQIAGRAGRFGLVERGHVGVLDRRRVGRAPSPALVESALQPHVRLPDGHLGYRVVDTGRIRPRLSDLGVDGGVAARARAVGVAQGGAARVRGRGLARRRVDRADRGTARHRRARLAQRRRALGVDTIWTLINAPVDEDSLELLGALALAARRRPGAAADPRLAAGHAGAPRGAARGRGGRGRTASILRWFALQFSGVGGVTIERAAALEQVAAERVVARLQAEVA